MELGILARSNRNVDSLLGCVYHCCIVHLVIQCVFIFFISKGNQKQNGLRAARQNSHAKTLTCRRPTVASAWAMREVWSCSRSRRRLAISSSKAISFLSLSSAELRICKNAGEDVEVSLCLGINCIKDACTMCSIPSWCSAQTLGLMCVSGPPTVTLQPHLSTPLQAPCSSAVLRHWAMPQRCLAGVNHC